MSVIDIKRAMDNLTCPICCGLYRNPKFLLCHHSYCVQCVEKMQIQSKITCPECRMETAVPAEGVQKLPNNFLVVRLVDELILKRKVSGEQKVKCDECNQDDPVVAYCPDCNSLYCHICSEAHKRSRRYPNHTILSLSDAKVAQQIQPKPTILLCEEHENDLNYYCDTCKKLVCFYCTTRNHLGHNHDTVKRMASTHRVNLEETAGQVEQMLRNLCFVHDHIEIAQKKIRKQGDDMNVEIDKLYDELFAKLVEQKKQLKEQVYKAVSLKEKEVVAKLEQVECVQTQVLSMKELCGVLETSSDQEALSAKEQIVNRMRQLTDAHNNLNTEPVRADTMELLICDATFPQFYQLLTRIDPVNTTLECLPEIIYKGNKVEFQIVTKYETGDPCLKGGNQISVRLESSTGNVTTALVEDNSDGSYTASFEAKEVGEAKVFTCVNGLQAIPRTVTVASNYLSVNKATKTISCDGKMGCPWGIAFGINGVWAFADHSNHCVCIYDHKDQLIQKFDRKLTGDKIERLHSLYGIAFDYDNNLYVVEYYKDRVLKFDVTGGFLMTFGSKGRGRGQLSSPVGITAHGDRIFVAEASNNRVSIFRQNGSFCLHIGSEVLNTPYDLTVNPHNQLLVVDYGHNCVYKFALDGQYIGRFNAEEVAKSRLSHPCSIAVDSGGCVLVADTGNCRVVIFDKDGNFLHSFGSKGCNNRQFYDPHGIALSLNGNIYVSDNCNHRIQVFQVETTGQ